MRARLLEIGFEERNVVTLQTARIDSGAIDYDFLPQKAKIEERFKAFVDDLKPGDFAFVFLSGHGIEAPRTNEAFFVPIDFDPDEPLATSVSVDAMTAALAKSGATFRWFAVDACRSRSSEPSSPVLFASRSTDAAPLSEIANVPASVVMLQSCRSGQSSYEGGLGEAKDIANGFFTLSLLEALDAKESKADANKDGVASFLEICRYVTTRTKALAQTYYKREQEPTLSGADITDFPFLTGLLVDGLPYDEWKRANDAFEAAKASRLKGEYEAALDKLALALQIAPENETYRAEETELRQLVAAKGKLLPEERQEAEKLAQEALEAYEKKDWSAACAKMESSLKLFDLPSNRLLLETFQKERLANRLTIEANEAFARQDYETALVKINKSLGLSDSEENRTFKALIEAESDKNSEANKIKKEVEFLVEKFDILVKELEDALVAAENNLASLNLAQKKLIELSELLKSIDSIGGTRILCACLEKVDTKDSSRQAIIDRLNTQTEERDTTEEGEIEREIRRLLNEEAVRENVDDISRLTKAEIVVIKEELEAILEAYKNFIDLCNDTQGRRTRFAILIGVGNYVELDDLQNVNADIDFLETLLQKVGFSVVKMTDNAIPELKPTKKNIERILARMLTKERLNSDLVITWRGRCAYDESGTRFLAPSDARKDGNGKYDWKSFISCEKFSCDFKNDGGFRKVCILDCIDEQVKSRVLGNLVCGSKKISIEEMFEHTAESRRALEAMERARTVREEAARNDYIAGDNPLFEDAMGLYILTSSTSLEVPSATYYFAQGLSGLADNNNDGYIMVSEVCAYVGQEIIKQKSLDDNAKTRAEKRKIWLATVQEQAPSLFYEGGDFLLTRTSNLKNDNEVSNRME